MMLLGWLEEYVGSWREVTELAQVVTELVRIKTSAHWLSFLDVLAVISVIVPKTKVSKKQGREKIGAL